MLYGEPHSLGLEGRSVSVVQQHNEHFIIRNHPEPSSGLFRRHFRYIRPGHQSCILSFTWLLSLANFSLFLPKFYPACRPLWLLSTFFLPSNTLTHCMAALLRIVNSNWRKELGRRTGLLILRWNRPLAQAGSREEVMKKTSFIHRLPFAQSPEWLGLVSVSLWTPRRNLSGL